MCIRQKCQDHNLKDFHYKVSNKKCFYRKGGLQLINKKRIIVFTGDFGSGKTETAINYAIYLHSLGEEVTIVDLDLVNPFFRVRAVKERLQYKGIKVISPDAKLSNADLPVLPAAINSVFEGSRHAVIDVGGDGIGASALSRFREQFVREFSNIFFVVNTFRPGTRDEGGIIKVMRRIELSSRLKINALISNTNLGLETDKKTILEGYRIVAGVARKIGLPVAYIAARSDLAIQLDNTGIPVLPVELFMNLPWENLS